jgi:hypothetical protein
MTPIWIIDQINTALKLVDNRLVDQTRAEALT